MSGDDEDTHRGPRPPLQSGEARDRASDAARKARGRVRSPVHGVPELLPEEVTGQYEGEELDRVRARRPTNERIARLEAKHDALLLKVAEASGELRGLRAEVGGLAVIHTERTVQELRLGGKRAETDLEDAVDRRKAMRAIIVKAVSVALSIAVPLAAAIGALLHRGCS